MSTEAPNTLAKIVGLISGAAALTIIAIVASAAGQDGFARGAIIGGVAMLVLMAVLWARGTHGGTAARIANGVADEREQRLFRDASADAGLVMFVAATGGAIWALFDAPEIAVAGIVLWSGLITFVVSFAVRSRRG